MKKTVKYLCAILGLTTFVMGCASPHGSGHAKSYTESRHVGNVRWHKSYSSDASEIARKPIPNNKSRVFFFRKNDNGGMQTSVNVALNSRFQTSIQPNRFSYVLSCTGTNELGAMVTGKKNNYLNGIESSGIDAFAGAEMAAGQNYYFEVGVQAGGEASMHQVTEDVALRAMSSMMRQSHQISRVEPNCAYAPARIKLEVYFDTAKSYVKPRYRDEIERAAEYLRAHKDTSVVIEGHTDSRAGTAYNQRLSENRARAVVAVLVNKFGIAPNRLQAIGYGESRPAADNRSAAGRQKNRRVIALFSTTN